MEEPDEESSKYSSMKEDPEYLLSLLDKYVKVELVKNTSFNGFVHSIDPVTKSMILSIPNQETFQTTLIPGHAIMELNETSPPENAKPPPHKEPVTISDEEISSKKIKLKAWLKKNLLPLTEEGENLVVGSVNILPPYDVANIYAENPVVALQIKNIMGKMPDDFNP
ncbi:gemin6 protein domain-containing protein [Phthorimaea operculella]|nr:gemin6 protein domain-containing protein [Phthorimaea operculella]